MSCKLLPLCASQELVCQVCHCPVAAGSEQTAPDFVQTAGKVRPRVGHVIQVKALEAADAARRKEAAKNADRIKQKGTLDKQRAERAKVSQC